MTDIKTMSPTTGEVITKTGEVVNLVDVLGGATPVDETVYDIESYSPRTGLIIGSDGRVYDLVDLLQGGSGPSGDCVTKEELEQKLQPIQDSVSTSEDKVSAMEGKVATCESKVIAIEKKVDGMDAVSIDMVEDLQEQLDKSEAKVDALWKLNRGQTYDFKEEVETGTSDAPAGAHYMSLEEVQGDTRQDNYHMGLAVDAGTVEGCAEAPIREMQMFGKTEQASTNGYNLYNSVNFTNNTTSGIAFNKNSDGSCSVKGTSTGYAGYGAWEVDLPVGTYYVGAEVVSGTLQYISTFRVRVFAEDATYKDYGVGKTFILEKITRVRMFFQIDAAWDPIDVTLYPYVCEASAPHVYEPYTGGTHSPNPDYPQKINSVEEIKICASNNLFNPLEYYSQKKFKSSENSAVWWSTHYLPNGNYIVKTNITVSGGNSAVFATTTYRETPSTGGSGVNGSKNITVTKGVLYIGMYGVSSSGTPHINSAKTIDFETYMREGVEIIIQKAEEEIEEASVNYAFITPPRPLNKIGSLADVCDVENGIWRYKNKARTIKLSANSFPERSYPDSTDLYGSFLDAVTGKGINDASNRMTLGSGNVGIVANKFRTYTGSSDIYAGVTPFEIGLTSGSNFIRITVPAGYDFTDIGEVDCVYTLAQEEVELVNEEDLTLLRKLVTYSGVTNVFVTDQLGRDISSQFRFRRDSGEETDDVVAPTPLYPSALRSVEEINIKAAGKNLAINASLPAVTSPYYILAYVGADSLEPDTTYTISFEGGGSGDQVYLSENLFTTSPTLNLGGAVPRKTVTVKTISNLDKSKNSQYDPAKGWKIIKSRTVAGNSLEIKNLQIELGEKATPYVEPTDLVMRTITPPRPLNAVDSYVDIADIESGLWKYRTESFDRDYLEALKTKGTEFYQENPNGKISQRFYKLPEQKYVDGYGFSDHWAVAQRGGNTAYYADFRVLNSDTVYIRLPYEEHENALKFDEWVNKNNFVVLLAIQEEQTYPIDPDDLAFLRFLELLPADHHITITDQDGNDVSYLMEYIIKLSEVVS